MVERRYVQFLSLIQNINRYVQKLKNTEMKELGLKGNQAQCLFYLYVNKDGLGAKQLSEYCEEDKAAISRTLKDLQDKGLVYTEKGDEKTYRNPHKLTPQGLEKGKYAYEKIISFVEIASYGVADGDRATMYSSLTTICDNLRKICKI